MPGYRITCGLLTGPPLTLYDLEEEVTHVPQANPAAARLAKALRDAMKDQALRVSDVAKRIERLTGVRPEYMWVSRATSDHGYPQLIRVHPDLAMLARALDLDPLQLVIDAISPELAQSAEAAS
jgi:hypothetical protein